MKTLPPTHEAFIENIKRAHFQAIIWYSTLEASPPDIDPTLYGWQRDMENRILSPVGLPDNIAPAPEEVLDDVTVRLIRHALRKDARVRQQWCPAA